MYARIFQTRRIEGTTICPGKPTCGVWGYVYGHMRKMRKLIIFVNFADYTVVGKLGLLPLIFGLLVTYTLLMNGPAPPFPFLASVFGAIYIVTNSITGSRSLGFFDYQAIPDPAGRYVYANRLLLHRIRHSHSSRF